MANSRYAYVRMFEEATTQVLLPDCFVVVRVDGQSFRQLSRRHGFQKPNDRRACDLMLRAAQTVVQRFSPDIGLAFGQSDEFSFLFRRSSRCHKRHNNKLVSLTAALFAAAFTRHWNHFFPDTSLLTDQAFDARAVLYPSTTTLRHYLSWRQVDCHVNNLFNSTFHALTGDFVRHDLRPDGEVLTQPLARYSDPDFVPLTPQQATQRLSGSVSADKNEILFSEFGVNYNNELQQFRKGSVIILTEEQVARNKRTATEKKAGDDEEQDCDMRILHTDIIGDKFWIDNKYILDYLDS